MLAALLTFFLVGLAALASMTVLVVIVGVLLSVAFGVVSVFLFKVLPILLIAWLVVKLIQRSSGRRAIADSDRRWLDT